MWGFSLGSCFQPSGPCSPAGTAGRYLLAVDELVVEEKEHPLLALGLWLCDKRQLPRVDEFRAPDQEVFPLGTRGEPELSAPTLELRGSSRPQ